MCEEFPYVAIGGIVTREIKRSEYGAFRYLINEAHKRGAKIHGLGFTNLRLLPQFKFDSVDSSSWTGGNRFGFAYRFNGKTLVQIRSPGRIKDHKGLAKHNFLEWSKFCEYADKNL